LQANIGRLVVKSIQTMRDSSRNRPVVEQFQGDKDNEWRNAKIDFVPENDAAVSGQNS